MEEDATDDDDGLSMSISQLMQLTSSMLMYTGHRPDKIRRLKIICGRLKKK